MRASTRLAGALVACGLVVTPVHALTKKEKGCQAAIAKTGQAFVKAELANRAKCKMAVAAGNKCDPTAKTNKNKAKLRKVVGKCGGVTLSNLGSGGCAERGGTTTGLADCLATGHADAVASLINDQFGLVASEEEVVLQGTLAQATSTLLPPANLTRYRAVGVAPVSLADLTLYCVTFTEPAESASTAIAADGSFSLSIEAANVPFGCFVVDDATGEQVATLVFRSSSKGDATQIQSGGGTLVLGTVSLDLGTGEAVVNADGLGDATTCAEGVTNPADFTGSWNLTCVPGPAGSGYGCPPPGAPGAGPKSIYLHRVPGTAADGTPTYWLGMWDSVQAFSACGQVEGLATTAGGTTTAAGETLGVPDGPFAFASDDAVFAAIDAATAPTPPAPPGGPGGGGPQPMGICNSTAPHCSGVQNNDGAACTDPQPGTPPSCWGRPDFSTQPPTFVPFSNAQCQKMCFSMNLFGFGGPGGSPAIRQSIQTSGLCVQAGIVDMSVPPDHASFVQKLAAPLGRQVLAKLNYSCDDAGSVVAKFPTLLIGLPPAAGAPPGPPQVCHVTQRAEITLKMDSPSRILGQFKQTTSLAPGDPAACTDASNPQNPVAHMLKNPMSMLFTLTR